MQVRPGRETRGAHIADDLSLLHSVAGLQLLGIAAQMGIGGLVGLVVSEADVFAEAAEALPLHHDAVSGRQDRRPARRGKVQALVHSGVTEDRMVALAEERRQAASVDRSEEHTSELQSLMRISY